MNRVTLLRIQLQKTQTKSHDKLRIYQVHARDSNVCILHCIDAIEASKWIKLYIPEFYVCADQPTICLFLPPVQSSAPTLQTNKHFRQALNKQLNETKTANKQHFKQTLHTNKHFKKQTLQTLQINKQINK